MSYAFPPGGLPEQNVSPEGKAIFTEAYAMIPAITMRDIVTSFLPGWTNTRAWIIARPMTGFAETFAQYAVEIAPGGGSDAPEPDAEAQAVLFVAAGRATLTIDCKAHQMGADRALAALETSGQVLRPTISPQGASVARCAIRKLSALRKA